MVAHINAQHSVTSPVIYYQSVPFLSASQRAAIWSVGEILACTPIREGMNAFPSVFTIFFLLTHFPRVFSFSLNSQHLLVSSVVVSM